MRILDLGSHDGYISNFLGRKVSGLHVDGVDLNPDAVRIATERAARDGIPGSFKVGLAEDAPDLFDPGTYDAVIAFELIEHVPDVAGFLDAVEMMCKPGGRVYLSTPDGTFGAGQNPHHLRVYRAVDLADLLRRRGTLHNMIVGRDGIAVAVYEPWQSEDARRGDLAIYCGPGWEQWSPSDIERPGGGLGGSETAAVRLAEALSDLGYTVTVYGEVEQCAFRQVIFRHHAVFDPLQRRDVVIASRLPQLFDRPVNAGCKLLWMHDTDCGPELTVERAKQIDAAMVLSDWQVGHVLSLYPFLGGRVRLTSNAINPDYFRDGTPTSGRLERNCVQNHTAVYSSSPDRGLDFLLKIWPRVREQVPDAELRYCYSSVYDAVAEKSPPIAAFRDTIRELAEQDGVINLGSLSQPDLAREMQTAHVWVAPSWSTPASTQFAETFCIGAVEAAAAGCRMVASKWGALPERAAQAAPGQLVLIPESSPGAAPDEDAWVEAIVAAFAANACKPSPTALELTWECVARDFLAAIERAAPLAIAA